MYSIINILKQIHFEIFDMESVRKVIFISAFIFSKPFFTLLSLPHCIIDDRKMDLIYNSHVSFLNIFHFLVKISNHSLSRFWQILTMYSLIFNSFLVFEILWLYSLTNIHEFWSKLGRFINNLFKNNYFFMHQKQLIFDEIHSKFIGVSLQPIPRVVHFVIKFYAVCPMDQKILKSNIN